MASVTRGAILVQSFPRAAITGDPMGLASALQHIGGYAQRIPMDVNPAAAQLAIINPLSGSGRAMLGLFRTRPDTEKRIAGLREIRV